MRNTSSSRTSIVEAECVRINDVEHDERCGGPCEQERQRAGGGGGDCHGGMAPKYDLAFICDCIDVAGNVKVSDPRY